MPTQDVGGRLAAAAARLARVRQLHRPRLGARVVVIGLVLGLRAARARHDRWFGLSLASRPCCCLCCRSASSPACAGVARHAPAAVLEFRIPSRYTIPFLQFAALTAAWASAGRSAHAAARRPMGARRGGDRLPRRIGALDRVNRANFSNVFTEPPFDTSFHWMGGPQQITDRCESSPYAPGSPMLRALMEDRAFYLLLRIAADVRTAIADRPPCFGRQSRDRVATAFHAERVEFTIPDGAKPTRAVLESEWAPGWTSTAAPIDRASKDVMGCRRDAARASGHVCVRVRAAGTVRRHW